MATWVLGNAEGTTRPAGSNDPVTWTPTSTTSSFTAASYLYTMTLWPSVRRPGLLRRNAHTSSSRTRQSVGNALGAVRALTTAVGHPAVRSIVTRYLIGA